MSAGKRKRRDSARSFGPGGGGGPRVEERWLSAREVNVPREVDSITDCAARGEARIVTLGVLVFFSTAERSAWMLDVEDGLACCLMEEGERQDTPVQAETGEGLTIAWESQFAIEGGCFFTRSADGKLTAWPAFPAEEIRRAILRARTLRGETD